MAEETDDTGALAALTQHVSKKVRTVMQAYLMARIGWGVGKALWARAEQEFTFRVSITSKDDIYADAHHWLLERIPERKRKSLTASTRRNYGSSGEVHAMDSASAEPAATVFTFYDGRHSQNVDIDGHRIRVWIEEPSFNKRDDDDGWFTPERMNFLARSPEGRDAVLAFLDDIAQLRAKTGPRFFMATRWGDWNRRTEIPGRDLRTVVLAAGVRERIIDDLGEFLAAEADYAQLGVPWHRGFLLHGPPGTGKTSLAKAIAGYFGLDMYYVPLSDLTADTNLLNLVSSVPARAVLLLEDIDIVHAASSRDDAESSGKISLSALLNALDGIVTPHGLVTILTTNDLSVLDEALIRPGRADVRVDVGYLAGDQLARLLDAMCGHVPLELPDVTGRKVSPADVVDILKRYIGDPVAGAEAVAVHYRSSAE